MNVKKTSFLSAFAILFLSLIFFFNTNSKAATVNPPIYLGIQEYRTNTDPTNMAYGIGNPDRNGSEVADIKGAKIWDIVQYSSESDTNYDNTVNYYCVKAGVGFRNTGDKATYNIAYDFKKDRSTMAGLTNNEPVSSIVQDEVYYKILALTDLMYIPGESEETEKMELITNALRAGSMMEDYSVYLTDVDLEAVQQAALWYFTNYDDELFDNVYNQLGLQNMQWFTYKIQGEDDEYKAFSDYPYGEYEEGLQRQKQAIAVYNYLINTAIANEQSYKNGTAESRTQITLYTHATNGNNTQPIIKIEKLPPEEKEFDLALRKYITKVDNVELSVENTRVPSIDEATLTTSTTATYKHRKDPVAVSTGTVVTYNLTIYNEGEKPGRATKIVDQLPTGLIYKDIKTDGFTVDYDEATNRITITRSENNTTNLNAYTQGNLQSETIEIECEVTQKPDSNNSIVLTNVAWIQEEYDAEDDVTITNQEGADRDSEPATVPDVNKDNMTDYKGTTDETDLSQNIYYPGQQDDDDFEKLIIMPKAFDLKLIKRIAQVNGQVVPERLNGVDVTNLANGTQTTANYDMNKTPVTVKQGDIVKYTLRVYNEGDIDGYASEISEDIPEGLEFLWSEKVDDELDQDTSLTEQEKEAIKYNQGIWSIGEYDSENSKVTMITTDYLAKGQGAEAVTENANLIKAFDKSKGYIDTETEKNPDYKEVSVYMKVVSTESAGTVIRNEAAITGDTDANGDPVDDRDSQPENWPGRDPEHQYQDDEDYDNIVLEVFDLALRKFIAAVSPDVNIEEADYLVDEDGTYLRAPQVDTSKLNQIGEDGQTITTATYNHPKTPVQVNKNNYVVYMFRVYNEGQIDGYVTEITDYLPEQLEFVEDKFNDEYGWTASEDGRVVKTDYLKDTIINKATENQNGNIVLTYKEVPILCKVKDTANYKENITNIAEITDFKDEDGEDIVDRDSQKDNVTLPSDEELPAYKEDEVGEYVPGQEDDDDFEKVIIRPFDLALRKFITAVDEEEVTTRVPELTYNEEEEKIEYNHTKDPVEVVTGDIVTYTIRIYNEGDLAGYAKEVADDIPEGLEFLPENETNQEYRWVMYDAEGNETENIEEAVKIVTDYLSKEQGEARMEEDESLTENPNLLKAYDAEQGITEDNPDYRDVKVVFKVVEPNTSDKIIINSAQIQEDEDENGKPVEDIDSTPGEWNEGEDDQDKEYIKLTYFDLALRKWVTQAIVIEDGKETITQTGHTPDMDPEPVVKVEIHRKKINEVTVKFRYSIRVTNEGDIAGYAKEITDYVPEGLRFVAEDNPGWTDEGNNVISTRLLENTLLQPGESADVEVLLTWINGENNLGLKTNTAEISEDDNEKGAPDIDSTPDNKVPGEDDIDDAEVILSISTGRAKMYLSLGFVILITLGGGVFLIKKYVL